MGDQSKSVGMAGAQRDFSTQKTGIRNDRLESGLVGVVGEVADQPGDYYFAEDDWVGPDFYLAAEMSALRVDPGFFGDVAAG